MLPGAENDVQFGDTDTKYPLKMRKMVGAHRWVVLRNYGHYVTVHSPGGFWEGFNVFKMLDRFRWECAYWDGYEAFFVGDAGQWEPGRSRHWYEGYEKAMDDGYKLVKEEIEDVGRSESLRPWEW